jgi:hypothetical protein
MTKLEEEAADVVGGEERSDTFKHSLPARSTSSILFVKTRRIPIPKPIDSEGAASRDEAFVDDSSLNLSLSSFHSFTHIRLMMSLYVICNIDIR